MSVTAVMYQHLVPREATTILHRKRSVTRAIDRKDNIDYRQNRAE
jgi:hypothetical protein